MAKTSKPEVVVQPPAEQDETHCPFYGNSRHAVREGSSDNVLFFGTGGNQCPLIAPTNEVAPCRMKTGHRIPDWTRCQVGRRTISGRLSEYLARSRFYQFGSGAEVSGLEKYQEVMGEPLK